MLLLVFGYGDFTSNYKDHFKYNGVVARAKALQYNWSDFLRFSFIQLQVMFCSNVFFCNRP